MSDENELLARWLGIVSQFDSTYQGVTRTYTSYAGVGFPPNFRTSNEWAGTLLEKLGTEKLSLISDDADGLGRRWYISAHPRIAPLPRGKTWRDAVVDAALEIAKC